MKAPKDSAHVSALILCSVFGSLDAGLAHAHARKVVHADLKPQNILITNSGEVHSTQPSVGSTFLNVDSWKNKSDWPAHQDQ